jgi:hypothetical protein
MVTMESECKSGNKAASAQAITIRRDWASYLYGEEK